MYGGDTYNWELKAPAAYSLLAWKQAGLTALVENTIEKPTSKNYSLAFEILASASEGHEPQLIGSWPSMSQLREAVSHTVGDWQDLAMTARSHLHELVLSIEDDDETALYAGTSLTSLALMDPDALRSLSHALALRSIAVGPRVLAEYNELLARADNDESLFQHFFERHPLLLHSKAVQVWAQPDLHGKLEPDFILRTYDNEYVVVEIETAAKLLVTQQYQLSADTTHAVSQVLRYQEYLRTHLTAASRVFPEFTPPAGLVVVGRESSLNAGQKAVLRLENLSRTDISIVGFDTLADTAKEITNSVIHGIPGTVANTRLP